MKAILVVCALVLLAACGSPSQTKTNSTDTTQVVVPDTVVAEKVDSVAPQPTTIEPKIAKKESTENVTRCKYLRFEGGDCPRYIFDCASFGIEAMSLPTDQANIWNNLMAFDGSHGDAPIANAAYVGKTFEIVQAMQELDVCQNGGQTSKQKVATVTRFKLAQ